ncbi:hypothetical protein LguiA_028457 [Lonicera macranthoides]
MAEESSTISVIDIYHQPAADSNEYQDDDRRAIVIDQTFNDAKYAEELQFQEGIIASLIFLENPNNNTSPPPLSIQDTPSSSNPNPSTDTDKSIAESSVSFCEICVEQKQNNEMVRVHKCSHSFCSDCISKHVSVKIQDNVHVVACPGLDCEGVLRLENCMSVIPKEVIERWDEALTESLIIDSQKFYCPFKDCSAMLIKDTEEVIRESECPECRRLFCAQCRSSWHSGIECEEFQNLNADERGREDLMVRELAKEKNWKRCPQCKFYVEKTQGCLHMTCRCKFQFCYACGATWTSTHGGCQRPI